MPGSETDIENRFEEKSKKKTSSKKEDESEADAESSSESEVENDSVNIKKINKKQKKLADTENKFGEKCLWKMMIMNLFFKIMLM